MNKVVWLSMSHNFHSTVRFNGGDCIMRSNPYKPDAQTWLQHKDELKPPFNILVHGYHCTTKGIEESYTDMEHRISPYSNTILKLRWPGSVVSTVGFSLANHRAEKAGMRLAHMIDGLPNGPITIWAHSMGCKVALEAVQRLSSLALKDIRVVLFAPAIDNYAYDPTMGLYDQSRFLESLRVCYSHNDPVLGLAYRASIIPMNWFSPALGKTGLKEGIKRCPNYIQRDFSEVVHSHGEYRERDSFYNFGTEGFSPIGHFQQA